MGSRSKPHGCTSLVWAPPVDPFEVASSHGNHELDSILDSPQRDLGCLAHVAWLLVGAPDTVATMTRPLTAKVSCRRGGGTRAILCASQGANLPPPSKYSRTCTSMLAEYVWPSMNGGLPERARGSCTLCDPGRGPELSSPTQQRKDVDILWRHWS